MDIILIRHGETVSNHNKCFSEDNTVLTELGKEQMKRASRNLRNYKYDKVIISQMDRAKESLEIMDIESPNIKVDKRANEFNFGILKGYSINNTQNEYDAIFSKWYDDPIDYILPEGESQRMLLERVKSLYYDLIKKDESVLIITHDGVIRAFLCALFDTPDIYFKLKSENGSITIIRHEDGYSRLYKYNET